MKKIISILIITAGLMMVLYPTVSSKWNDYRNETLISDYSTDVQELDTGELEQEWELARKYNSARTSNVIVDAFGSEAVDETSEYTELLNPSGNGIMGYIEIPDINQRLPIYHGTSEKALAKGCGHLQGTSLPVGGKSSHAVIAGHRGLMSVRLFTDLDKLKRGSRFSLHILDRILAYEVDQIKVVLPEKTEEMQITPGRDYVTLLTCTPYGVNSHRLLVRGHRTKYIAATDAYETQLISPMIILLILLIISAVLLAIVSHRLFKVNKK